MSFLNSAAHVHSSDLLPSHFNFFSSSLLSHLTLEDMQQITRQSSDSNKSDSFSSCQTTITESSVSSVAGSPFLANRSIASSHMPDTPSPISALTPASLEVASSMSYPRETSLLRSSSEPTAASPSNAYMEEMLRGDTGHGSPRVNSVQSTPRDRLSNRRPPRLSIENGMTNFQLLSPPVPAKARVAGSMDLS